MKLHHNIIILTWFNFFTDFILYAPFAIIYFTQITGSFALGMSIFAIVMISSALFEIPAGVFSDRVGRKKTIICGAVAAVMYAILYAIGQFFWILAAGAIFNGLSRSLYSGNNDALLHDTLTEEGKEEHYAEYLGRISSMFQLALGLSAVLGGILATWSFSLIMWLSVIPQLICLYLAFRLQEPKVHSIQSGNIYQHLKEAYQEFFSNKKLRLLSISSIFGYGFGEAGFQFQAAFYNTLWPVWAIGLAKTFSNVAAMISFRFSGRLIKKFGGITLLLTNDIYNRVITIAATVFPSTFSPLMIASTSLLFGVGHVAQNSLMQREFKSEQRATMGSLNSFAGSIFFGLIAVLLGLIADKLSPAKALLILQFFQIINIWIYIKLFRHDRITD